MQTFRIPDIHGVFTYAGRSLSEPEINRIAQMAGEAYRDDEILNYLACGRGVVGITVYMRILIKLALRNGWVSVIYNINSEPISAAFWLRPGGTKVPWWYYLWLFVTQIWRVTGWYYLLRTLHDVVLALERAHDQAMADQGFNHDDHVYLLTVVTREDQRGEGLASSLMLPVWDECDRVGCHAYLEGAGTNNVRRYLRCGFQKLWDVPLWRLGMIYPAMVRAPLRKS